MRMEMMQRSTHITPVESEVQTGSAQMAVHLPLFFQKSLSPLQAPCASCPSGASCLLPAGDSESDNTILVSPVAQTA